MRSKSLRDARRAGEKTTHSQPMVSARQATKMAMLRAREGNISAKARLRAFQSDM